MWTFCKKPSPATPEKHWSVTWMYCSVAVQVNGYISTLVLQGQTLKRTFHSEARVCPQHIHNVILHTYEITDSGMNKM